MANKVIDPAPIIKKLADRCLVAKGLECSILGELIDLLRAAPAVDAVEVVHGRWKFLDIDGWWFDECSICGNTTPNRDGSPPGWNYCPNCGAKMDGGEDDVSITD